MAACGASRSLRSVAAKVASNRQQPFVGLHHELDKPACRHGGQWMIPTRGLASGSGVAPASSQRGLRASRRSRRSGAQATGTAWDLLYAVEIGRGERGSGGGRREPGRAIGPRLSGIARVSAQLLASPLNCERRLPNAATVNSPQWHRADTVLLLAPATGVRGRPKDSCAPAGAWRGQASGGTTRPSRPVSRLSTGTSK